MSNGLLLTFLLVLFHLSIHEFRVLPKMSDQSAECDCPKNNKKCKAEQFFQTHAEYSITKRTLNESIVLRCMGTVDSAQSLCKVEKTHYEKVRVECIYSDEKDLEEKLLKLEKDEADAQRLEDQRGQKSGQELSETSSGLNIFAFVAFAVIILIILIAAIWLILKRAAVKRESQINHLEVATNQARIIQRVEELNDRRAAPLDLKTGLEDENRDEVSMDAKEKTKTDSGKKEQRR